ncbi:hypothetical protein IV498_11500 [Paenarthrobacter sp. Z7-10]|uniref:baeRF2 domain-containing protein n=1 Tax=Paenarthrobacter sp. Z7-10 TaxID=2787635 RepID=UPI0022A98E0C|nr:Vms1/Ankzf1 family peptidyl-tRNA hydrolase [Paenarthrobacter sp. Z7-10]MCZ2403794.1 hypothetical protein [Paenarthrobacter sp. Z7-10]
MNGNQNYAYRKYAQLYRKPGPWCTVYAKVSTGTVDSLRSSELLPDHIENFLHKAGASKTDMAALKDVVWPVEGEPSPVSRFLLVRQGNIELDEVLPGAAGQEETKVAAVPDLLPLLKHRGKDFPYVVAEVDRSGGEISFHLANRRTAVSANAVEGSRENITKLPGGGWAQGKYQHRTEEIWRRNADEVAGQIDRIVEASNARLLVVAGDMRARDLVINQLADRSRSVVVVVDANTRGGGADPKSLREKVDERIAEVVARRQQEILDKLAEQDGQPNALAVTGLGAAVHALQQAQVEILLLDDTALTERTLLALDAEPWVATAPEEALDAAVLGEVPAATALLRAAMLTDAEIAVVPPGALPGGGALAALLRWPTGPRVPSART